MRMRFFGVVATALFAFAPVSVQGQATLGPTLALGDEVDLGIGATLGVPLTSLGTGVGFMGDFLIFFPDGPVDYFEFNANLTYDFPLQETTVVPFVLAGLNIGHVSSDSFDDTDLGLNLGGGIEFTAGRFRPSAGIKFEVDGGPDYVFFISLPFALGN